MSDTDTSAWRHRAFSPCASFLFEEGKAGGCKRTPRRQGFRHRAHNNTNTLCLLFPTRAACLSINALDFLRGKGTKSVPEGCAMTYSRDTMRHTPRVRHVIKKRQFDIKSRLVRHYKKQYLCYIELTLHYCPFLACSNSAFCCSVKLAGMLTS